MSFVIGAAPDFTSTTNKVLQDCADQLDEYFQGVRFAFDLPLTPAGTSFQQRVWSALAAIPYGEVISYIELSRRIGDAKAVRAVGSANGKNPIAILIPCHRVIGANGKLTGYAGELWRKEWLLKHELSDSRVGLFKNA